MHISVVIPTSFAPEHPKLHKISANLRSIEKMFGSSIDPLFVADATQRDDLPKPKQKRYKSYLKNLRRNGFNVLQQKKPGGLVGSIRLAISQPLTPIIFVCQDDWRIQRQVNVDWLFRTMLKGDVRYCVLSKKRILSGRNVRSRYPVHRQQVAGRPLIETNQFGDQPHFATREFYDRMVIPALPSSKRWRRRGVEYSVARARRRDEIKMGGRIEAMKLWKTYIYGYIGQKAYVRHTGISRRRLRRANQWD